ncbi:MAG: enoyl-CoA hydratase/isomerase family protein, partial [Proteobacteria bacterium]|nr:enoyl-CoA hydratase/isomerase family protein [Pseudomonadota bacterium]
PTPKVLIVTGAGRAFSAGGNLDRIAASFGQDPGKRKKQSFDFYSSFLCIRNLRIPTIAAVNGHAIGAGACLATACDMRIAAENAKIGFTFARIGLHPGMGAEHLLLNTVGEAKTYELLMTGDIIPAAEAYRIGLVNHVAPNGELMDKAMELARKICAMPDLPIKMLKDSIPAAKSSTLEQTLHRQASYQAINYMTRDFKEGIDALREKRTPNFQDDY